MAFKSEADMAAELVKWLHEMGWTVYQEVGFWRGCADIVAVRGPVLWVIECKMRLCLDVFGQAAGWKQYAHRVSIATPHCKSHLRTEAADGITRLMDLGHLEIMEPGHLGYAEARTDERISAPLRRNILPGLKEALMEEHKTFAAAGSASAKRWTPFKATLERIKDHVEGHPGQSLKEVIDTVKTHYSSKSSARGCMSHFLRNDMVPGVRIEYVGRKMLLFPKKP